MTSRHEGLPNALLEAMNHGIPSIISSSSGGALDYVKNNITGIITDNKPNDVAASMIKIIEDKKLTDEIYKQDKIIQT